MNNLKIAICTLIILVAIPFSSNAKGNTSRHEISVSYGFYPTTEFMNMFSTSIISLGNITSDVSNAVGAINLSYVYKLNKWIALGGTYSYSQFDEELIYRKETSLGKTHSSFHSIMPTAKFSWLNKRIVSLYSKASLGVILCAQKYDYTSPDGEKINMTDNSTEVGFQFTPIGIEVGNKVAGFAEIGIGNLGTGIIGIRFKF